jgi:hypothetical protein
VDGRNSRNETRVHNAVSVTTFYLSMCVLVYISSLRVGMHLLFLCWAPPPRIGLEKFDAARP